jgi:hypothetical protein
MAIFHGYVKKPEGNTKSAPEKRATSEKSTWSMFQDPCAVSRLL